MSSYGNSKGSLLLGRDLSERRSIRGIGVIFDTLRHHSVIDMLSFSHAGRTKT